MHGRGGSGVGGVSTRPVRSLLYFAVLLGIFLFSCTQASAIPAFARKYGLPCSSCHEAWPKLSPFGQQFKDNGYQLGNDRDAPIFQQAAYWPVAFRITPNWHLETANHVPLDNGTVADVKTSGFDYTGMDMLTAGTLAKNFSFLLVPSSDELGSFHFESVNLRFSNILNSTWFNIKVGKFELDNLLSEKRILTLSGNGGFYQNYHFQPMFQPGVPETYAFGIGDNQLGVEWMGHSKDDRTRLSVSVLQPTDGNPDFVTGAGAAGVTGPGGAAGRTYDVYAAGSHAFELKGLGLQRVGAFAYFGHAPTFSRFTSNGADIPGSGIGNEPYYRAGMIGMWYVKKFDFTTMYFYGHDSAFLAASLPSNTPGGLPPGIRAPSWNGGLIESHYTYSPQLIFVNRYELIRMSQQAWVGDPSSETPANPGNMGNIDALTFGIRYYPFINSRAGFAFHNEYSIVWQRNSQISPVTGGPIGLTSSSLLFGFDFAF
jgi:hypothetical protein